MSAIPDSHGWLDDYIMQHGPYDSVMCFFQGCSLVGSYLLYHAKETPQSRLPSARPYSSTVACPAPSSRSSAYTFPQHAHDMDEHTSKVLIQRALTLSYFAARCRRDKASGMAVGRLGGVDPRTAQATGPIHFFRQGLHTMPRASTHQHPYWACVWCQGPAMASHCAASVLLH